MSQWVITDDWLYKYDDEGDRLESEQNAERKRVQKEGQ